MTMVIVSPLSLVVVPLPNGRTPWLINGGDPLTTYDIWEPILQPIHSSATIPKCRLQRMHPLTTNQLLSYSQNLDSLVWLHPLCHGPSGRLNWGKRFVVRGVTKVSCVILEDDGLPLSAFSHHFWKMNISSIIFWEKTGRFETRLTEACYE